MSAKLLPGKELATLIQNRAQDVVRDLETDGLRATLAVVVATDNGSTHWYVRSIERAAERAGFNCRVLDLGPDATAQVLVSVLKDLSSDPSVNGIILQTPLPAGVATDELVGHIAPEKDIDGANPLSLGRLAVGQASFAPATARAVIEILDHFDVPLIGRNVAVIGCSAVVGKPLSLLLLERGATITVCHSRSGPLERYTTAADVVVVAAGRPGLVTGAHVSAEAVVIDVGTNALPDGSLVGDVDEDSVRGVAAALTPVPGGVGTVTTSLLLLQTAEAAQVQSRAMVRVPVG